MNKAQAISEALKVSKQGTLTLTIMLLGRAALRREEAAEAAMRAFNPACSRQSLESSSTEYHITFHGQKDLYRSSSHSRA